MQDDGADGDDVDQAIRDGMAKAVTGGFYLFSTVNGAAKYVLLGSSPYLWIEGEAYYSSSFFIVLIIW
jgi:hypothetical protein